MSLDSSISSLHSISEEFDACKPAVSKAVGGSRYDACADCRIGMDLIFYGLGFELEIINCFWLRWLLLLLSILIIWSSRCGLSANACIDVCSSTISSDSCSYFLLTMLTMDALMLLGRLMELFGGDSYVCVFSLFCELRDRLIASFIFFMFTSSRIFIGFFDWNDCNYLLSLSKLLYFSKLSFFSWP